MATKFSPCKGSYVLNQFPSNAMFGMNEFHVSASGAIQGHHGPLVTLIEQELNLNQLPVILKPTDHPDKPVIDFPLHLIFLCFKTEEFLKIMAYVLQEERLVFLSSNYSLLTIIMEVCKV